MWVSPGIWWRFHRDGKRGDYDSWWDGYTPSDGAVKCVKKYQLHPQESVIETRHPKRKHSDSQRLPGHLKKTTTPNDSKCTLWLCQNSYGKWPFILDFPIKNGGSFHSYVNVYQRVSHVSLSNVPTLSPTSCSTSTSPKHQNSALVSGASDLRQIQASHCNLLPAADQKWLPKLR